MVLSSAVAAISVAVQGHVESNLVALGITYALLVLQTFSSLPLCKTPVNVTDDTLDVAYIFIRIDEICYLIGFEQ